MLALNPKRTLRTARCYATCTRRLVAELADFILVISFCCGRSGRSMTMMSADPALIEGYGVISQ